ncbi:MAG TPA: signal peptide peptidase SppA [Novosphingobium sp.]|nr:signal peptide peptidase SppA [Novosphingobium sp.]
MKFARKVWKLLVAVKDGMALLLLLLFFVGLYAVLSARPGAGQVEDGALLVKLDGMVVEEASEADPLTILVSGEAPVGQHRSRDVVRALRLAAKDDRIKAVVLDLSGFIGGGFVHLQDIGDALDEVRAAKKKVLVWSIGYVDEGMLLAAHADEVWIDPMGGAFISGPGGNHLYFGKLLEKLKVTAHVFRVGTFKSAVEPWILDGQSDASRESYEDLYGAIWREWRTDFAKARPQAKLDLVTKDPVAWLAASGGDTARADKAAGLVDRIGSRTEFGLRVAELVGESKRDPGTGHFASTDLGTWLSANKPDDTGKAIGVVTIAGEIVDGDAGPGIAGGDRITEILDAALDQDLAALVVRVDSPGGSVIASEQIRAAIARYKAKGIPVVVSMANVAASGGYWVATAADRIYAEPGTITGSIGIFAILPTFERALGDIGVTGDGVKTTPLSGQPDLVTGLAPEVSAMVQANIENGYRKFVTLVSKSRGISGERAADWAEGRPWAGGEARQLRLVDQFGGLDDALAHAAGKAKLQPGEWHAEFLGAKPDPFTEMLRMLTGGEAEASAPRDLAALAAFRQQAILSRAVTRADTMLGTRGMQAYCLECPATPAATLNGLSPSGTLALLARLAGMKR